MEDKYIWLFFVTFLLIADSYYVFKIRKSKPFSINIYYKLHKDCKLSVAVVIKLIILFLYSSYFLTASTWIVPRLKSMAMMYFIVVLTLIYDFKIKKDRICPVC